MTALANRGYYVKTSDSVLPLSYNEIPTNCSALATDANGNIIAGSGGSSGSYLPLAGGEMVSGSKITWQEGNDPVTSGLVWFEPDGTTKRGELSASYLRLSAPVLNSSAPNSELNPYSLSICLGINGGINDISFAATTDGNGLTTLTQGGNAFTVDTYGNIKAKTGNTTYFTLTHSDGWFQSINSGVNTIKCHAYGIDIKSYFNTKWFTSHLDSSSLSIGSAIGISNGGTALSSNVSINAVTTINSGIFVSYVDNVLTKLPSATLGTDNTGKIINIRDKNERLIDGIAEIFLDTTDSEVVAYNIIFTLATPVEFKKGEILTIEVFGELAEINTNLINTGAKVGYGTNSVSYGAIDITHKDIVLFLADSSNGKGITIKSRQAMTVFDDQIDVNGISTSLGNMTWEIAYTDDTLPNEYSVIDSTNNLVVATTSNNKAKLIPYGVNSKAKSIGVFNNTKITDKFDRISIGIFTGFAKMDQFASCSSWTGLSLNTTPVKARIKVE